MFLQGWGFVLWCSRVQRLLIPKYGMRTIALPSPVTLSLQNETTKYEMLKCGAVYVQEFVATMLQNPAR